jgi:hypothetical protein
MAETWRDDDFAGHYQSAAETGHMLTRESSRFNTNGKEEEREGQEPGADSVQ